MVSPIPETPQNALELLVRIRTDRAETQKALKELDAIKRAMGGAFVQDNAKVQQARQQFERHRKDLERIRNEARNADVVTERWIRTLRGLERQRALDAISKSLSKVNKDAKDFEQQLDRVNQQLREMGAQPEEIDSVFAGAARRRGGVGGQLLSQVGNELRGLPAIPIPGTSISTEVPARVLQTLGRLNVSFKELATGGAIAVGATLALAAAIDNYQRTIEPTEKLIRGIVDAQQEIAGILAQNDPSLIVSRYEEALAALNVLEAQRVKALEQEVVVREGLENRPLTFGEVAIKALLGPILGDLLVDEAASGPLKEVKSDIADYNSQIAAQQIVVDELNKELLNAQIGVLQKEYTDQLARSAPILDQLQQQYEDLNQSFAEQSRQREEDARLQRRFLNEDRQLQDVARAENHQQTLAQIEQDGNRRIESLREKAVDRLTALEDRLNENLAKITADRDKRIAEITQDFQQDELQRARDFQDEERKIARDAQRERLRRIEDNARELLEAELANDVTAFLEAQRRQTVEGRRAQEDLEAEQADRRAAFEEERAERLRAKTERIADIRAEADERAQAAITAFQKEKAALEQSTQENIERERAAIAERTAAVIEAYNKETEALIEARERADQRQSILEGIQEQRRQSAHQAALAQIEQRRAAENGLMTDILIRINTMRNQLHAQTAGPIVSSSTPAPRRSTNVPTAFAAGTLDTRAIYGNRAALAVVNDTSADRTEAIIPYRRSEGLSAELARLGVSGGATINTAGMFAGATIGSGVTAQDLRNLQDTVVSGMAMALHSLRTGVQP